MLLSIIVPSYNHQQFVLSTLKAAVSIEIQDKEIIVIDDGSSDDSARVIREYIANTPRSGSIHLVARENRGLVKSLNQGLSMAHGRYFYVVASDDIPIPQGIASLVGTLETNPQFRFAIGNALFMNSEQQQRFRPTYGEMHRRFFALPSAQRHRELFLSYPQPLLLQSTVFRTEVLRSIQGWREDLTLDDMSMFTRVLSRSAPEQDFTFHPQVMACFYRRHPENISRNELRQFQTTQQLLESLCPPELRNAALLRNLIGHGVAALKDGKLRNATHFTRSTLRKVGLANLMRTAVAELPGILADRTVRHDASRGDAMVTHESAADLLKRI